jgi:hypothetical protein
VTQEALLAWAKKDLLFRKTLFVWDSANQTYPWAVIAGIMVTTNKLVLFVQQSK